MLSSLDAAQDERDSEGSLSSIDKGKTNVNIANNIMTNPALDPPNLGYLNQLGSYFHQSLDSSSSSNDTTTSSHDNCNNISNNYNANNNNMTPSQAFDCVCNFFQNG